MADESITLTLGRAEAIVLLDWLARTNEAESLAFQDQAEQRVLWNLEWLLERILVEPLSPEYKKLLAEARRAVRDSDD